MGRFVYYKEADDKSLPRIVRWQTLRRLFGIDVMHEPEVDLGAASKDLNQMGRTLDWYTRQMRMATDRLGMYREYSEMDFFDLISDALDIYSEDGTQFDNSQKATVWVESDDDKIKESLTEMLEEVRIEEIIPGLVRSTAKYGDHFEQILYNKEVGVFALNYLPPEYVVAVVDEQGRVKGFNVGANAAAISNFQGVSAQAITGLGKDKDKDTKEQEPMLQPWDILHFKIAGNRIDNIYGDSILRSLRRIWKQLKIMEDSVVMYRINRSPDRLVFYLDVGANAGPIEAQRALNLWRTWFKKRQYYDPATGEYRAEYNPMALDEDLFVPTTEGSATKIEKMAGSGSIGEVIDLEYFRDRVFAGLRIPKAYMGFEGDINAKATLAQQDIRYARTIKRIQRAIITGLTRLCQIHLAIKLPPAEAEKAKFRVLMSPVSYLDELQKAELWNLKMDMAQRLAEVGLNVMQLERVAWLTYILSEFVGLPDKFIKQLITMPSAGMETPGGGGAAGAPMPPGAEGDMAMGPGEPMPIPPEAGAETGMPSPDELGPNAANNFPPQEPFLMASAPSLGMNASKYVKPLADPKAMETFFKATGLDRRSGEELIDVMKGWWATSPNVKSFSRIATLMEEEEHKLEVELRSLSRQPLPVAASLGSADRILAEDLVLEEAEIKERLDQDADELTDDKD